MLLLWLAILVLIPFDLATIDSRWDAALKRAGNAESKISCPLKQ